MGHSAVIIRNFGTRHGEKPAIMRINPKIRSANKSNTHVFVVFQNVVLAVVEIMTTTLPFLQHRDGFGGFFYLASYVVLFGLGLLTVASLLLSQMVMGVVLWWIGLAIFLFGVLNVLAVEHTCRPPSNNAAAFQRAWKKKHPASQGKSSQQQQQQTPPILACVGDSITHGAATANYVNRVRPTVFQMLGLSNTRPQHQVDNNPLSDPLWVVNLAQNFLCSYTVYHERLPTVLSCHPDWVTIMIGSNDVRAMYKKEYSNVYETTWNLPTPPNWEDYRTQLDGIIRCLTEQSENKSLQIGLCTLPPMGEDLEHPANHLVRKANAMIHDIAKQHSSNCTILPVYEALDEAIRQKQQSKKLGPPDMEDGITMLMWMAPLRYLGCSWNLLSRMAGNYLLSDSLHLNEEAADIVATLIAKWLVATKIQARLES